VKRTPLAHIAKAVATRCVVQSLRRSVLIPGRVTHGNAIFPGVSAGLSRVPERNGEDVTLDSVKEPVALAPPHTNPPRISAVGASAADDKERFAFRFDYGQR
jgi:hypothetical protein